jgi:Kef-type K+ transport system membrane component KefB
MTLLAVDSQESFLLLVMIQLIAILVAARIGGWLFTKLGQPLVVGEIVTGLLLGPSALGRLAPDLFHRLFASETEPVFFVLGQLGLIFLMFVIGLEFDFSHLNQLGRTAAGVALSGIALPFLLGAMLAALIHPHIAPDRSYPGFVLFIATAMSITAIPILGRIMMEFRITRTPLGVLTISAAAVDDALGWILLAAVSAAIHGAFAVAPVAQMLGWTTAFVMFIFFVVRPLASRGIAKLLHPTSTGFSLIPFSIVLVAVLLTAVATNVIGIFSIFGPFVLGAALSNEVEFQREVRDRIEEFVTAFFLPVFFTYTGLRTNIGSLDSGFLWLICGLVIATAIFGKMVGCGLAAKLGGMNWRDSACVAVMMNTRALMGLIAVNIGRDLGVIPDTIFCMMVLMAIATTIMTSPILRWLLRHDANIHPHSSSVNRR